jgi:hypothetical protein
MPRHEHDRSVTERYDAIVAGLGRLGDIRSLTLPALHVVMTMRLCALMERAGRDPLTELSTRYRSVAAAKASLALADRIARYWPTAYQAARPCSMGMTPDETTLAAMVRAALAGDRRAFDAALAGFVRGDRHENLFDATVQAVVLLDGAVAERG